MANVAKKDTISVTTLQDSKNGGVCLYQSLDSGKGEEVLEVS